MIRKTKIWILGGIIWMLGATAFGVTVYAPDGSIRFYATAPTQGIVITYPGFIGMGTLNPTKKLDVVGDVKATSFIGDGSQLTGLQEYLTTVNADVRYLQPTGSGANLTDLPVYLTTVNADVRYLQPTGSGASLTEINAAQVLQTIVTKTAAYTVLSTDSFVLASNSVATRYSITLPLASSMASQTVTIKKTDANNNIIDVLLSSTEMLDGVAGNNQTPLMTQGDSITLMSDGITWRIISRS